MLLWRKLSLLRLKRKMNTMFEKVLQLIDHSDREKIEFGNARKGNLWHSLEQNKCIYTIEIDLLSIRPLLYTIAYDFNSKEFTCHSRLGSKNELNNLLQFRTDNFSDLSNRLYKLAENIPDLRGRMIKEYMYNQSEAQPKRRWLRFFKRSKSKIEYLESVLENLHDQGKISTHEVGRAKEYIRELVGK